MENTNNETKVVKAVRIEPVNYMSSKEEEIKTLEKIQKIALNGSFLAELFTDSLVSWAKTMIKSDNMPNLFDRFVNQTSEIANYQNLLKDANENIDYLRETIVRNSKTFDEQREKLERILKIEEKAKDKYFQEREELSDMISQDQQKYHELWLTVQDRNLEILKLKAYIYDLEHQEG